MPDPVAPGASPAPAPNLIAPDLTPCRTQLPLATLIEPVHVRCLCCTSAVRSKRTAALPACSSTKRCRAGPWQVKARLALSSLHRQGAQLVARTSKNTVDVSPSNSPKWPLPSECWAERSVSSVRTWRACAHPRFRVRAHAPYSCRRSRTAGGTADATCTHSLLPQRAGWQPARPAACSTPWERRAQWAPGLSTARSRQGRVLAFRHGDTMLPQSTRAAMQGAGGAGAGGCGAGVRVCGLLSRRSSAWEEEHSARARPARGRAPGAHRDHAREADLPARRMARQAQRGGAAVARRAPRARTAIMHAKKICQPSAWLNELASSSNANSRPPMGALNATAMPTAVPAWRTPWRVRACVCVSIAWLAAHIRVHPTPCMNVPASWSCAPVRATTHTRPQALQRLCSVARALDCNPRPCQSPAHPGPYSHPLHWSPWVAPIISSRAS